MNWTAQSSASASHFRRSVAIIRFSFARRYSGAGRRVAQGGSLAHAASPRPRVRVSELLERGRRESRVDRGPPAGGHEGRGGVVVAVAELDGETEPPRA
jgi:hypothetical protein